MAYLYRRSAGFVHAKRALYRGLTIGAVGGLVLCLAIGTLGPVHLSVPFFAVVGAVLRLLLASTGPGRARKSAPLSFTICGAENLATSILMAALLVVLVPAINEARDTARRSQCRNHLHQHSGCHPDCIILDESLEFSGIFCCPWCTWFGTPPYLVTQGTDGQFPMPDVEHGIPSLASLQLASWKLGRIRGTPTFRQHAVSTRTGRFSERPKSFTRWHSPKSCCWSSYYFPPHHPRRPPIAELRAQSE